MKTNEKESVKKKEESPERKNKEKDRKKINRAYKWPLETECYHETKRIKIMPKPFDFAIS